MMEKVISFFLFCTLFVNLSPPLLSSLLCYHSFYLSILSSYIIAAAKDILLLLCILAWEHSPNMTSTGYNLYAGVAFFFVLRKISKLIRVVLFFILVHSFFLWWFLDLKEICVDLINSLSY